ncbi:hypothetical protein NP284_42515, partial [Rhodopseudomonas pseudopalustris]|uniref:hypothetical protein n=1 Tax=Rhodopseudomonas pseudopalustris TaxID=1513892 RepID=UPI003F9D7AC2
QLFLNPTQLRGAHPPKSNRRRNAGFLRLCRSRSPGAERDRTRRYSMIEATTPAPTQVRSIALAHFRFGWS